MTHSFLRLAMVAGISTMPALLLDARPAAAETVVVGDELERLAVEHDFSVRGLEQTEEALGKAEGDTLYPRLRRLLQDFDHVIVQSPEGGVDRVIVLGEKVPFEPQPQPVPADAPPSAVAEGGDIVLQTERRGTQHVVSVSLEAAGGGKIPRELHVDTGADYLVLPRSLLTKLGMKTEDLQEREMQTANGRVNGRIGTLPALWLGEHRIVDVKAAFIEDGKLGEGGLLGMSVLGRYKMTMDDDKNRITLAGKDVGDSSTEEPQEGGKSAMEDAEKGEAAPADPGDKTP